MSVANELTRIVNAKKDLAEKAHDLGLKFTNEQGQEVVVSLDENGTPNGKIDDIAEAFDQVNNVALSKPVISVGDDGKISASVTQNADGYVKADTQSATENLVTQSGGTITPTKSEQVAVAKGKFTTGDVKVSAIPNQFVDTTGITKDADDLTVDGHKVNVPAGYYPQGVSKGVQRMVNLEEHVNPLDEMVDTNPEGIPVLLAAEVNAYVENLYIGLDSSLENALKAI